MRIIKEILSKILQNDFVRFGIVGSIATMIHYGVYYVLNIILNYNAAYSIGYCLSFLINFGLSAKFTFKTKATTKRGLGFALSHLVNYGLQIFVLNVCLRLGISEVLAPIPVYTICIPINFLSVRFVFKKI